MTTITNNGTSGNWHTATLWTGGLLPGTADIAAITAPATLLLNDAQSVGGVTLNAANALLQLTGDLFLDNGTFNAQAGTLVVSGTLEGGYLDLSGATVSFTDFDPVTNGAATPLLSDIAITGTLDLSASTATVEIQGILPAGLGDIKIGAGSELLVMDTENLHSPTIDLAGGVLADDGPSLSIGAGVVVVQNAASTTARIGADTNAAITGLGVINNFGTILAEAGSLVLAAESGGIFGAHKPAPVDNFGTIVLSAGATLVDYANGTVASLGTILNNGGLLDIEGTLDNSANTLTVGATGEFANLQLDANVTGGAIVEAGGTLAIGSNVNLGSITLSGTAATFNYLNIGKAVTLNPGAAAFAFDAIAGGYGIFNLHDGADLANATIGFGAGATVVQFFVDAGATATLEASTTIDVGAGQYLTLDGGGTGTFVDHATINIAAGGRLVFGSATYAAAGTINLAAGGTIQINGSAKLSDLGTIVGTGGTLNNVGALDLGGATLDLSGGGPFSTVNNGGYLNDGTIVQSTGTAYVDNFGFSNATFQGALRINTNGTLNISSNLHMTGANGTGRGTIDLTTPYPQIIVFGIANTVNFLNTETLSNADILVSGLTSVTTGEVSDAGINLFGIVTFAPDVLVQAGTLNGPISIIGDTGVLINQGTIAVAPGADLFVTPYGTQQAAQFVNTGFVTIAPGGTLDVSVNTSIAALGSIAGAGGLLRLSNLSNNTGTYDNTANTLQIGGAAGYADLELDGAVITGGSILNAGGRFAAIGATLKAVTYTGPLDVGNAPDTSGASRAGALTFLAGTLDSQSVTVEANAQLDFTADQSFTGATLTLAGELADTGTSPTLSFDASTVVDITGSVYMPVGHLLNAGTVLIRPGGYLDLYDSGAIAAPELSRSGTIVIDGGTFISTDLNTGQTAVLSAGGVLSIASRYDAGTKVAFQGPATMLVGGGGVFDASISGFGAGDKIELLGFNYGLETGTDPTIALAYDGSTLTVTHAGTTLEGLAVGPGYDLSGFTATPVGIIVNSGGTEYDLSVTEYDITYAAPGLPPPSGPSISSTTANQPVTDRGSIDPFASVVIADPNQNTQDTAIVTLSGAGTLSNLGAGTLTASGYVYAVTGAASAVQTALRGLVFTPTPHIVAPGQTITNTFTLAVSDNVGIATDKTTSVIATAQDDPPVLAGFTPSLFTTTLGEVQMYSALTITDPDIVPSETVTVSLSNPSLGQLAGSSIWTAGPNGSLTYTGDPATALVLLNHLSFGPTPQNQQGVQILTTGVTLAVSDGISTVTDTSTTISVVETTGTVSLASPVISRTSGDQHTTDNAPVTPLATLVLTDPNAAAIDTAIVVPSNPANGTFANLAGGTVGANGDYTLTGTAAALQAALRNLQFIPTPHQVAAGQTVTTQFAVIANDGPNVYADSTTSLTVTSVACYAEGTRILTDRGEIAIEHLATGDRVQTLFSGLAPITWLGRRSIDCRRHPNPAQIRPVRIRAHAFGPTLPHRDLLLSPDHAVFVDGMLVPIKRLLNGATIAQLPADSVTYFHLELPAHDIVLAEGLPAESFLDTGTRAHFSNAPGPRILHPDFTVQRWEAAACAPLVVTGPALEALRAHLAAPAKRKPRGSHRGARVQGGFTSGRRRDPQAP